MLTNVSKEGFASALRSEFVTKGVSEPFIAELVSVDEAKSAAMHECFSLVFKAPAGTACEQMIYSLEHPALGAFELFLVPIKRSSEGVFFEAVINRAIH